MKLAKSSLILTRVFSTGLALLGVLLLIGGVKLLAIGGSLWYATTGAVLILSALLLWLGSRWGSWLYGFMLTYTLAWSLWEVGLNGWALVPRLLLLSIIGLCFFIPVVQRGLSAGHPSPRSMLPSLPVSAAGWAATVSLFIVGASFALALVNNNTTNLATPTGTISELIAGDWRNYGNDNAGTRYSDLAQINTGNVAHLKLAWSFNTGDNAKPEQEYNFENTPLKIGRLMYLCTPSGQVFALDAATGKMAWHFDPKSDLDAVQGFVCRGVSYYDTGSKSGACLQRIYVPTPDAKLWGVDALTGRICADFGEAGAVDLTVGLGQVSKGTYRATSPPVVTHGKLVLGAIILGDDDTTADMPSGVVRAFDAVTGKLAWAWDVGRPDRKDAPTPPESYTRGTPNAWAPLSADDQLGLIYIPTGNPGVDFWGKTRRAFDEQYGSSLVAVDINTGDTRWSFQVTHHDVWDYDVSSQPVLVDVPTAAGIQPAVIVGTKQGHIFVINRATGVPIVPITEKPAPSSSNIGEPLAASQPASEITVNPGPAVLTEFNMWGMTPIDQMWCRLQYRKARYLGPYTPPGTDHLSIVYPGMFGGIEWGGVTVDPVRKILISNPNAMPFLVKMTRINTPTASSPPNNLAQLVNTAGLGDTDDAGYTPLFYGFMSPLRIPCMQPPWGKLYAIDLKTNKVMWERPVGTTRDTGPLGLPSHVPALIGTPQVGGTIVTRGGLIFSAATLDQYLRAYDLATGKELWKARLPAGGQATPMTFKADGHQFVVIAAGGHGVLGTKTGDHVLAYALDD